MTKTAFKSLYRVFPSVHIFRNSYILEEIKSLMMKLF